MDRTIVKKLDEGISVATRIAESLEKLVNEPLIEITPPPPQCPNCGRINPEIQTEHKADTGNMMDFVLEATCLNCGKPLFAFPSNWVIEGSRTGAIAYGERMRQERENSNG
jgi:hypothetical protein